MKTTVTLQDIEDNIKSENYFTAYDGAMGHYLSHPMAMLDVVNPELKRMTFCVLTLKNGFMVFGESSCVSLDNYDEQLGRKYAREKAISKCWELMGYELKSILAHAKHLVEEKCKAPFWETHFPKTLETPNQGLSFGQAIEAIKAGKRVARAGWNGKGMWICHVKAYDWNPKSGGSVDFALGLLKRDWVAMKTADEQIVPWAASQTDILAEDWAVVL